MKKIIVGLEERSYPIWISKGIWPELPQALKEVSFPNKVAVITNPTVGDLYGDKISEVLSSAGYEITVVRLPDGEEYKTLDILQNIYDVLIDRKFDRYCGIIALGGGVIGDTAGFAAATYLRGIPFVQIPTTLLSQVDSSVGGKTGVNHPQGKNLIGAFYQPQHVHIDVDVLATLSDREYVAGLAEVVKYGIIWDDEFFKWLEDHQVELLNRSAHELIYAIMMSCQIKANVVENDEKEQGLRALLNLGHTFGHAVETLAGYGVIKHGEAVSIGMIMAAKVSCKLGYCTNEEVDRIVALLKGFGLPIDPPDFSPEEYLSVMQRDKKVKDGQVRLVLNHGIGSAKLQYVENLEMYLNDLLT